jgi:hypothetical protein
MTTTPSLISLEEEEKRARARLAVFRAKLYKTPDYAGMAGQMRLNELDRTWKAAAARLRLARHSQTG